MEETIDRQIEMEEKKYFWGRFTLDMLKFAARLIQKKVNNDSLEQDLHLTSSTISICTTT